MSQKKLFDRTWKIWVFTLVPSLMVSILLLVISRDWISPAPPNRIVVSTSNGEGEYGQYAKLYQDILRDDGVHIDIRPSEGSQENLQRLKDPHSDVEVGFVQDGLGSSEEYPDLVSLGSLYYEPIWIFYRGKNDWKRVSHLIGKKIAIGKPGGGTHTLAMKLLNSSGVNEKNASFQPIGWDESATALKSGTVDAAFFMGTADDRTIHALLQDKTLHLMDMDQAEAITRQIPFLHHLVLPHGGINLKENIPERDVNLVSPTATLLVKDSLHPALIYLLLKATSQVHSDPGLFEKKNEFPIDKDYQFPLADEAKSFFKNGLPFWQRYLPFWLASLVDRFILILLPLLAILFPLVQTLPKIYEWHIRSKIYQRYGELKFLETQISVETHPEEYAHHIKSLDHIEEKVNLMKVPLKYTDHLYGLRGHIDFVRQRLQKLAEEKLNSSG